MNTLPSLRQPRFLAFLFCVALFFASVKLGLLVPLYCALLAYSLIMALADRWAVHPRQHQRSRWLGVAVVAGAVLAGLLFAAAGVHWALSDGNGIHDLMQKMGEILASARGWLPQRMQETLPQQDALLNEASAWLKQHSAELGSISLGALATFGLALIGLILGGLIAIDGMLAHPAHRPVSGLLLQQLDSLREAFWQVASAQVKISLINTCCTAIFLLFVLPAMHNHLPLTKTLIALTFFAGLLPVIGNLISNTAIFVIALNVSIAAAISALAFLIVIHKLEYFINAKIVGGKINARVWELLIAMVIMERLLGVVGVVAAPVFYAWLKSEWLAWDRRHERAAA
ncbi:MAG: hypothetical protein U1F63_04645 [Chitinivorax sp.]